MTVTTTQIYVGVTTEFSVGGSGIFGKFTFGGTAGASPKLVNTYLQGGYTYYTYSVLSASVGTLTVTDSSSASATINFVVAGRPDADARQWPGGGIVGHRRSGGGELPALPQWLAGLQQQRRLVHRHGTDQRHHVHLHALGSGQFGG